MTMTIFRHAITSLLALVSLTFAVVAKAAPTIDVSRDYLVNVWQTDNGLPQNWVSSIAQTPDGYLWIGTRYGGLARFDGVRFVGFTPQNTPELRDIQVERLTVDSRGALWIATTDQSVTAMRHGRFELFHPPRAKLELRLATVLSTSPDKILFNTETGNIAKLDPAKGTDGWSIIMPTPAPEVWAYNIYPSETFHCDHEKNLWYIDGNRQLARVTIDGKSEPLPSALQFRNTQVKAVAIDAKGILWIVTNEQIISWDGRAVADHTPEGTGKFSEVQQIAFSGDGGLWIVEKERLRKLANNAWVATADSHLLGETISSRHYQLYGDSRGGAWIASYGRGLLHARADGTTHLLTGKDGLPSNLITCWFEDNEGNVWIGTTGDGIARIRERIFRALGKAEGMPEKVVSSVGVDDKGDIWAGTMSGQLTHWSDGKVSVLALPRVETTPLGGITLWPSRTGKVWIGSLYHGLLSFENGRISPPVPLRDAGFIRVFFEDSKRRLWIGQFGGLCCYADGEIKYYGTLEGYQSGTGVGALTEDANGALWIGAESGDLWRFQNNQFTRYALPAEWPRSRCVSLQTDADGVVWMGTLGNGLVRFQNGRFARFGEREGLPDNNITQLLFDRKGDLWGGSYAGIFHIKENVLQNIAANTATALTCTTYGREDGLPALECTAGFNPACWRADDGRLLFSTVNGLVVVDPSAVHPNLRPPDVIIEELHVDGKVRTLAAGQFSGKPPLEIEPGKHFLQFRFTGLSFSASAKVRFSWKIEGINRDWQDGGTQRVIGVGPLDPGIYQLQVRACNSDGIWNEKGATIAFRVMPYFWETTWFKTVATIILFGLILGVMLIIQRNRYRRSMEQLKRQRELEEERTRIARDLHDDLGTSLTQISMLSALANRAQTSAPESKEIIQQMSGRARQMVTALDEIVWAVNPKNDSWPELAHYFAHYAEEFFRPTNIRCRLDISEHMPPHALPAELRHHLFLAFKEALNNAARHSGASHVWVRIETVADEVLVTVKDDGHGIAPDAVPAPSHGNGLINMRRRMEEVNGKIEVHTSPTSGTTIVFHVPV